MLTTIPPLPASLIPALPFLSMLLTDWLRHSTLPKLLNVLFALLVPLFIAASWGLLDSAFTPNIGADFVLIVALIYAVMALPDLAVLRAWLQDTLTSPFALTSPSPAPVTTTAPVTPYSAPRAITLPGVAPATEWQGLLSGTSLPQRQAAPTPTPETTKEPPTTA